MGIKTKLNARLALWQKAALFEANISANKISAPEWAENWKTKICQKGKMLVQLARLKL